MENKERRWRTWGLGRLVVSVEESLTNSGLSKGSFFSQDRKPGGRQVHWFSDSLISEPVFLLNFWPFPEGHSMADCLYSVHHFLVQGKSLPRSAPVGFCLHLTGQNCHIDPRKARKVSV